MTDEHERYHDWAAAYVLSALEPAERSEYERHLASCTICQNDVREFAVFPGLLNQIGDDPGIDIETDPTALAAEAAESEARVIDLAAQRADSDFRRLQRQRRGWQGLAVGAISIAAALLLAIPLGLGQSGDDRGTEIAYDADASGDIFVDSRDWGTRIELDLIGLSPREEYRLWTVDDGGNWAPVMSWPSPPEGVAKVAGGTALDRSAIDQLVITSAADQDDVVLTAGLTT